MLSLGLNFDQARVSKCNYGHRLTWDLRVPLPPRSQLRRENRRNGCLAAFETCALCTQRGQLARLSKWRYVSRRSQTRRDFHDEDTDGESEPGSLEDFIVEDDEGEEESEEASSDSDSDSDSDDDDGAESEYDNDNDRDEDDEVEATDADEEEELVDADVQAEDHTDVDDESTGAAVANVDPLLTGPNGHHNSDIDPAYALDDGPFWVSTQIAGDWEPHLVLSLRPPLREDFPGTVSLSFELAAEPATWESMVGVFAGLHWY
eukprot:461793-Pleurochrysis_carterae.AAC.1